MRWILLLVGAFTLLLGLTWWPMGVGELGWFRTQVFENYKAGVGDRWTPEDPIPGRIVARFESYLSRKRALEAGFLLCTAMVELAAASQLTRIRRRGAIA